MVHGKTAAGSSVGRICSYLLEMFPPYTHIPYGLGTFAAIYLALQAISGFSPLVLNLRAGIAALSVVLFLLLLRVYDELKDVDTDLRLGKLGDPRYIDRAIVTGRIHVKDLVSLRWFITIVLFALNIPLGWTLPGFAFLVLFTYTWFSFKWFFWPAVSRSLILAFLTHNPMTLALFAYVVAVFASEYSFAELPLVLILTMAVATWFPVVTWEVARKIRAPEEETEYPTYSKILGWRQAIGFVIVLIVCWTLALLVVANVSGLGIGFMGLIVVVSLLVVGACLRFLFYPSRQSSKIRPFVDVYLMVSTIGFAIALWIEHGIRFVVS